MAKAVWKETVLAESDSYEVVEGNVYFPSESVYWEYFDEGDREYTCPWKGEACYYHLKAEGEVIENAAWSYPDPKPAAENIKGYVAFERSKGIEVKE